MNKIRTHSHSTYLASSSFSHFNGAGTTQPEPERYPIFERCAPLLLQTLQLIVVCLTVTLTPSHFSRSFITHANFQLILCAFPFPYMLCTFMYVFVYAVNLLPTITNTTRKEQSWLVCCFCPCRNNTYICTYIHTHIIIMRTHTHKLILTGARTHI